MTREQPGDVRRRGEAGTATPTQVTGRPAMRRRVREWAGRDRGPSSDSRTGDGGWDWDAMCRPPRPPRTAPPARGRRRAHPTRGRSVHAVLTPQGAAWVDAVLTPQGAAWVDAVLTPPGAAWVDAVLTPPGAAWVDAVLSDRSGPAVRYRVTAARWVGWPVGIRIGSLRLHRTDPPVGRVRAGVGWVSLPSPASPPRSVAAPVCRRRGRAPVGCRYLHVVASTVAISAGVPGPPASRVHRRPGSTGVPGPPA